MTEKSSRWWEASPFHRGSVRCRKRWRPWTALLRHHSTPFTLSSPGTSGFTCQEKMGRISAAWRGSGQRLFAGLAERLNEGMERIWQ